MKGELLADRSHIFPNEGLLLCLLFGFKIGLGKDKAEAGQLAPCNIRYLFPVFGLACELIAGDDAIGLPFFAIGTVWGEEYVGRAYYCVIHSTSSSLLSKSAITC